MISNNQHIPSDLPLHSITTMIRPATPVTVVCEGDRVSVDYTGWHENSRIFDTTKAIVARRAGIFDSDCQYTPASFIVGSGAMIKGFEDAIIGLAAGTSVHVSIEPEQAYGEYDLSLIKPVPIAVFEKVGIMPHIDQTLYCQGQHVRVDHIVFSGADVNNSTVYVDFNHPLASKTLHFMITVCNIEPMEIP